MHSLPLRSSNLSFHLKWRSDVWSLGACLLVRIGASCQLCSCSSTPPYLTTALHHYCHQVYGFTIPRLYIPWDVQWHCNWPTHYVLSTYHDHQHHHFMCIYPCTLRVGEFPCYSAWPIIGALPVATHLAPQHDLHCSPSCRNPPTAMLLSMT